MTSSEIDTPVKDAPAAINLTSASWDAGEREKYMRAQGIDRTTAGAASGMNGAVTVAYGAYAARAGLEALKQGGNAIDAAMTTALAQVALTAGAPISYFGIMSLVYYEAKTGKTFTMNAEWNTVAGEDDAASIPGGIQFGSDETLKGRDPSGRTALVGGFMKGVEAAHKRFGRLPFASLFQPAIEIAEDGMPVSDLLDWCFDFREADFARLPATREVFLKPDGSRYRSGDQFRQPQLAQTLRKVAAEGADHMYGGAWGEKLVAAIQADGGKMTLDDLKNYQVIWADPIVADIGAGYAVATAPYPNMGGVALIEAQNLAAVAGIDKAPHWTKSAEALKKAVNVTQMLAAGSIPAETLAALFPGVDFSPAARITRAHAEALWPMIQDGSALCNWKRTSPMHSDDVVAIDRDGNIAAITQSINCVIWGKTLINIDGVSIGDPASFQQAAVAQTKPGARLPAPTETGVVFKDGQAVLGFASMGAGLHQRTLQGLLNVTAFGMDVEEAINTADFYLPSTDPATGQTTVCVPNDRFDQAVLDGTGYAWREVPLSEARLGGEGKWVAISRDPNTGRLKAASHNRNNSDAVAF
jgi:gamma-glutamyltranspeptidase/glutathione hydrolase